MLLKCKYAQTQFTADSPQKGSLSYSLGTTYVFEWKFDELSRESSCPRRQINIASYYVTYDQSAVSYTLSAWNTHLSPTKNILGANRNNFDILALGLLHNILTALKTAKSERTENNPIAL